ncbi:flavodoxin domain-containing protein [Oceaniradius stylonematis]|uniref:flavodoxin domain-containing protein n=1 Tax=Oceaniradius stylonematis TaxID=2184161 RepID=UPI00268F2F56|nr:flavodoxin domain-containing protein [Oceaniradius stylonematis]
MKGAIFYATRYGSTGQYARWIAEATGLDAYDIDAGGASIGDFDFLVLGSPVIYHKLMFWKWVRRHLDTIAKKPVIVFTVSGVSAGEKLDGWIAESLPQDLIDRMHHVALRGRQDPRELTRYDRMMLIIGSLMNRDRQAAREELHGFDFMDKDSIGPVVALVERLKAGETAA